MVFSLRYSAYVLVKTEWVTDLKYHNFTTYNLVWYQYVYECMLENENHLSDRWIVLAAC